MALQHRIRLPLLGLGTLSLLAGLGSALVRLGWEVPLPNYDMLIAHGALMVCGFLGTLISLERAVALDRLWAYGAPLLTGAGSFWQIFTPGAPSARLLIAAGSLGLVLILSLILRRHPSLHGACLSLGAALWSTGNLLYFFRFPLHTIVPWWVGFLLLTIAGERLELSRLLLPGRGARSVFLIVVGVFLAGAGLTTFGYLTQRNAPTLYTGAGDRFTSERFDLGARLIGLSMLGLCAWLFRFDIARRSLRQPGLPRFIATCLLSGYVWLGAAGLIFLLSGGIIGGLHYDAALHAFFLGFVFAMIFGHAPIIFPGVLGVRIRFRRSFYVPLLLLHLSLILRVFGDLSAWHVGRKWGGFLNALILLLFLANTARSIRRPAGRPDPAPANSTHNL